MNDTLYREIILDHYKHPRNFGHLAEKNCSATLANSSCGDNLTIELFINPTKLTIDTISFSGEGCAISQASASLLSEAVLGKNSKKVLTYTKDVIHALLGVELTVSREKCALLSLQTLQIAITDYFSTKK